MTDDDDRPKGKVSHEVGMPIDTMSVEELQSRIALLEAEIARLNSAIEARRLTRSAADSIFRR